MRLKTTNMPWEWSALLSYDRYRQNQRGNTSYYWIRSVSANQSLDTRFFIFYYLLCFFIMFYHNQHTYRSSWWVSILLSPLPEHSDSILLCFSFLFPFPMKFSYFSLLLSVYLIYFIYFDIQGNYYVHPLFSCYSNHSFNLFFFCYLFFKVCFFVFLSIV